MKHSTRHKALLAVEKAINEIHRDPAEPNTLNYLASAVRLSPSRFHNLYCEIVGETVGAYVQRARMEFAVKMLRACPDMSLTRAAHASGHAELSHFSRAFKAFYGLPPSDWDRKETLKNCKNRQAANVDAAYKWISLPERPTSANEKVVLRSFPPIRLAVMRVKDPTQGDNLLTAFNRLEEWAIEQLQFKKDVRFMGLTYSDLFSAGSQTLAFELAYPVDSRVDGSGDIVIREMPSFTAAVVHCNGGVPDFVSAWDRLHRGWLPESRFELSPLPTMEIYFNDPRESDMTFWDMDCVLPVQ